jgi:hypothetical protein
MYRMVEKSLASKSVLNFELQETTPSCTLRSDNLKNVAMRFCEGLLIRFQTV